MTELTAEQVEALSDIAWNMAKGYYRMHLNSQLYWTQDLKATGKTDVEILKEFITTAYWYGYMDGTTKETL